MVTHKTVTIDCILIVDFLLYDCFQEAAIILVVVKYILPINTP